jgi:peptidoglycan/xylan/chitin deacetylase (PgdA/CDA1 family)
MASTLNRPYALLRRLKWLRRLKPLIACAPCVLLLAASACTVPTVSFAPPSATRERDPETVAPLPGAESAGVIARNDRFVVYVPRNEETLASIASEFLGDATRAWEIASFNHITSAAPGEAIAIPLRPVNPLGISAGGYQTVPILCYHRVGPFKGPMVMPRETFAAQMDYLASNGYQVIRLADLPDFLAGKRALPPRAVVITFDDGHISSYQQAYPILRQHGFAATFFLYTDFLGVGEGLSWAQIEEMSKSGLIDFQSHSKTHSNLIVRQPGETDQRYRERIDAELRVPREVIERKLPGKVTHHAFPFGDANPLVLERLKLTGHQLGLTVNPGGNAFFAFPLMLRRTMIFGGASMDNFRAALQASREAHLQ